MIENKSLRLDELPASDANDDAMFAFAHTFGGYKVWGGFEPCALVANQIAPGGERTGDLPDSLTLLRTALFFEARRERYVDFGGFADLPEGWAEHRGYMRELLERIREQLQAGNRDDEDEQVAEWLETHPPATLPEELLAESLPPDDDTIAAAVALSARMLGLDARAGRRIDENRLRDRLIVALTHLTSAQVHRECHVAVRGFRGVGAVDVVLRHPLSEQVSGLIECKCSVDTHRDKIYEGAWDAIKLALADVGEASRWLITAAPKASWAATETPDLFTDGVIETDELWTRELRTRGPNGGMTVGADCESGGYGNMFTDAPERLRIKLVAHVAVPDTDLRIKAARVVGGEGRLIHFSDPPEFPQVIREVWLKAHVPAMPADQFERLLAWLRTKRWNERELERVLTLRAKD